MLVCNYTFSVSLLIPVSSYSISISLFDTHLQLSIYINLVIPVCNCSTSISNDTHLLLSICVTIIIVLKIYNDSYTDQYDGLLIRSD